MGFTEGMNGNRYVLGMATMTAHLDSSITTTPRLRPLGSGAFRNTAQRRAVSLDCQYWHAIRQINCQWAALPATSCPARRSEADTVYGGAVGIELAIRSRPLASVLYREHMSFERPCSLPARYIGRFIHYTGCPRQRPAATVSPDYSGWGIVVPSDRGRSYQSTV